jgi:hypothetical protein
MEASDSSIVYKTDNKENIMNMEIKNNNIENISEEKVFY